MKQVILQYWVLAAQGVILGLLAWLFQSMRKLLSSFMQDNNYMKAGIQAVLRDRIIQNHNNLTEKGFATVPDRDNINNLYEQYHHLGANGVIDTLVEEVMRLPIKCRPVEND